MLRRRDGVREEHGFRSRGHIYRLRRHEPARTCQQGDRPPDRRRRDLPNDAAVIRLVGALLSERTTSASSQRGRYLSVEPAALILSAGLTEENSLEQQHQHQKIAELNAA